jgi:hypothetical protein
LFTPPQLPRTIRGRRKTANLNLERLISRWGAGHPKIQSRDELAGRRSGVEDITRIESHRAERHGDCTRHLGRAANPSQVGGYAIVGHNGEIRRGPGRDFSRSLLPWESMNRAFNLSLAGKRGVLFMPAAISLHLPRHFCNGVSSRASVFLYPRKHAEAHGEVLADRLRASS